MLSSSPSSTSSKGSFLKRLDSMDSTSTTSTATVRRMDSNGSLVSSWESEADGPSSPLRSSGSSTVYHPVISSMIRPNTLRNCHDVQDMMAVCAASTESHGVFVCDTAKKYQAYCTMESSGSRNLTGSK
eukprot:CAMPEP_0172458098 /NCGR_PEP_ID=MMETSP1065-20121228/25768_1 /TAXON_ID=265537 /ORGANISM="Amphiprora paludosa, Strain CCMP125" /LENGTH=128 /DNA_ID=CAMNT_0013212181 /DNA_START=121 /DNA_END=507 /DNA_ORIENTATION=+